MHPRVFADTCTQHPHTLHPTIAYVAPNRYIYMHLKSTYMHPKVSIYMHLTTAYVAPNRSIDMHPKGAYMHPEVAAYMHPTLSFLSINLLIYIIY